MPFLMPSDVDTGGPNRFSVNGLGNDEAMQAANMVTKQDRGWFTTLVGDTVLGGVDLVDTVASSIPVLSKMIGAKRGQINDAMLRAIDSPGLNDFYNDNKGGIEVASGIMGIVGAELVTRKFTAPAGALMQGLKTIPYARRIATLDAEYANAMQAVRLVDQEVAKRGALGMEQYVGKVGITRADGALVELSHNQARRGALALGFAKGARNAAATEAVMAVGLNQNGFLYQDDMAHNLAWMGLGVGLGGAFERFSSAYQLRKYVNSDEIRRTFANALDPSGEEADRLIWHGKKVKPDGERDQFLSYLGGSVTDRITNLLVNAKTLKDTPLGQTADALTLSSNRSQLATQHLKLAREEIQKVTTKGISTNGFTRFDMESRGYANHVDQIMYRDPTSLYGVEQLGGVPEEATIMGIHTAHTNRLQERIDELQDMVDSGVDDVDPEVLEGQIKRLKYEQGLTPVPIIDGEAATLSDAQALDNWAEPEIRSTKADADSTLWETVPGGPKPGIGIDSNLEVYLPGNAKLEDLDHFDMLRLYRVGQRAMSTLAQKGGKIAVPAKASWFQLDMVEELIRNSDGKVQPIWPAGMTRESAQVESFAQKAEQLKRLDGRARIKKVAEGKKGREYNPDTELSKLRVRFNLPRLTAYERGVLGTDEHPIERLLRGAAEYGADKIRGMTLMELKKGASDFKRIGDFAPSAASDFESLTGSSFRYMLDEFGKPTRPLIAYKRSVLPNEWTQDNLAERMAAKKIVTVSKLTDESQSAPMTSLLTKAAISSPDFDQVARTSELMDTQIQGTVGGTANQSPFGAAAKALKNADWRDRDNPILLAATRFNNMMQRLAREQFQLDGQKLQELTGTLNSPRNAGTKLLLNQLHSFRAGWDLALQSTNDLVVREGPDGKPFYAFLLARTEKNRNRWKAQFGEEMPKGQTLVSPKGQEVVLDELGLDIQSRFNEMTDTIRSNKNSLLRSQGLREIERVDVFTPPPSLQGKYVGFTLGPDGKPVPGLSVVANTEAQFKEAQARILKEIEGKGMGYTFATRDQIQDFASIWDRAQMDMLDPSTTAIQGGKQATGRLTGFDVDMNAFDSSLNYIREQYLKHANDLTEVLLKDQINSSKARANISSEMTRNRAGFFRDQQFRSVYDYYLQNLLGTSPLASKGSLVGKFYNAIEGTLDDFLASGTAAVSKIQMPPPVAKVWQATNAWIDKLKPWDSSPAAKKDFESLSRALGPHMPFQTAAEMAERAGAGSMPPKLADLMGATSRFTATVMLRMFETAMPIMNLAGMVNSMPSVIRHTLQTEGESAADYAARVGHSATIFNLPDGRNLGVLDIGKIAMRGFKNAWSKTSHADFDYMRRNGFLNQEVAEFHKQFGAIESKADWERFMFGDPSSKSKFAQKGVIGWTSVLTDKSEDFSRSWGHMVGLQLADELGIKGLEARNVFAHDLANKMIANYNPHNRPEVFQGAVGAPLGLFQSFIMNYYQRMFRYIETKDYRSLATQYAMQGSLFGAATLPGWSEASHFFFNNSDGDVDLTSSLHQRFGQQAGDLLLGGTISNVPKLFGQEAIDLYSRGDTDVRLPGLNPPPAVTMGKKIFQGFGEVLQAVSDKNPNMSMAQLSEIASNMIPNRPLAGMVEQFFAGGNDTDNYGQLVSDTKSWAEATYRVMGTRSMRQSQQLEAFYTNKGQQELINSRNDILRTSTRAAIRAGDTDKLPEIFEQYLSNGGDPRYFRRWLKSNYEAATESRAERQLDSTLKNPEKMGMTLRLLDAQVGIDADENTVGYDESLDMPSLYDGVNSETLDYGTANQSSTLDNEDLGDIGG